MSLPSKFIIKKYSVDRQKQTKRRYYLVGQERALCPSSLQMSQRLGFLEGGSLVVVVAVKLVVAVLELTGVVVSVEGSETLGMGHVTSLASSGQNSLIFWKRYH